MGKAEEWRMATKQSKQTNKKWEMKENAEPRTLRIEFGSLQLAPLTVFRLKSQVGVRMAKDDWMDATVTYQGLASEEMASLLNEYTYHPTTGLTGILNHMT